MTSNFNEMIAHVTGGRRFSFVIMSYREGYAFFERIRHIVAEATGCECIRADDIPPGGDLRAKIHGAIDGAVFVIADVSEPRPNIYYEAGYAEARGKPILYLARQDVEVETDLHGVELLRYSDTSEGWAVFETSLRKHLAVHRDSSVSLLRAMLLPQNPEPSYILANPRAAHERSRFQYHPHERRTYGDYLGVVGILGAFASVYGEHFVPELLTASRAAGGLIDCDANFFLIGSPKTNRWTGKFLDEMQQGRAPRWTFVRAPGEEEKSDYKVVLSGHLDSGTFSSSDYEPPPAPDQPAHSDFGLILRGPHPRHPHRLVMILAGPHSLGTGAACLAATKSQLIRQIRDRLPATVDLTAHDETIWVLVKGKADADRHIDPWGVEIVEAGVLSRPA